MSEREPYTFDDPPDAARAESAIAQADANLTAREAYDTGEQAVEHQRKADPYKPETDKPLAPEKSRANRAKPYRSQRKTRKGDRIGHHHAQLLTTGAPALSRAAHHLLRFFGNMVHTFLRHFLNCPSEVFSFLAMVLEGL